MLQSCLIESFFIVTPENLIFEVKGVLHPKDRIIAFLRYVPSANGDRTSSAGMKYKKIYNLENRMEYLRENFPKYIFEDPYTDRVLQAVPEDCIEIYLSPVDYLANLLDMGRHIDESSRISVELARILVLNSKIPWSSVGITGSQLLGLEKEESDIDLVVYGEEEGHKVHQFLTSLKDGMYNIRRYCGNLLDEHVSFRWGQSNPHMSILTEIESRKSLQGVFNNREFFIRAVKYPREMNVQYGDFRVRDLGRIETTCIVHDDKNSIFTPCEYYVSCSEDQDIVRIVSYRGRFTEQVSSGAEVLVGGKLERVEMLKNKKIFKQIILEDSLEDFLFDV